MIQNDRRPNCPSSLSGLPSSDLSLGWFMISQCGYYYHYYYYYFFNIKWSKLHWWHILQTSSECELNPNPRLFTTSLCLSQEDKVHQSSKLWSAGKWLWSLIGGEKKVRWCENVTNRREKYRENSDHRRKVGEGDEKLESPRENREGREGGCVSMDFSQRAGSHCDIHTCVL